MSGIKVKIDNVNDRPAFVEQRFTIYSTGDILQCMAGTLLLIAKILHDEIIEKQEASQTYVEWVLCAANNLASAWEMKRKEMAEAHE